MTRSPDTFIIGAAKCGTTSIYRYLNGHAQIYVAPRKEPRYFAPDLPSRVAGKNLRHGADLDRYLDLFAGARGEKRLGEASVRYIYSHRAPRLIADFQPRPFIIAMLRDPIDMMHSYHAHRVAGGAEVITDFEQALSAEPDRRRGIGKGAELVGSQYRARARFGEQLARWFEVFGRQRIHVIILEDLIRQPAAEFRQLLEFLEVDPDYQPESYAEHNSRHQPRSRLVRSWLKSRPAQLLLWRLLPAVAGERGQQAMLAPFSQLNRQAAPRPALSPELRRRLQDDFAPDVRRLSELLGRDMAALWWREGARQRAEELPAA